jgi:hypothetical protein
VSRRLTRAANAVRLFREMRDFPAVEQSLTWIVGSPRSGSTWLAGLLSQHKRVGYLNEPLIGLHLGVLYDQVIAAPRSAGPAPGNRMYDLINLVEQEDYFFRKRDMHVWGPALRRLLLTRFRQQMQRKGLRPGNDRLLIKEPHGSEAADIVTTVMPECRLLVLVRDGRDVVDSELDAIAPGAWSSYAVSTEGLTEQQRMQLVEQQAHMWVLRTRVAQQAHGMHDPSRRMMVRYEDLLTDTGTHVERIYRWLGVDVPTDLAAIVDRGAFASLPEDQRGPGKFARAASPGLWRERFTIAEQSVLTRVMGDQLASLGYEVG